MHRVRSVYCRFPSQIKYLISKAKLVKAKRDREAAEAKAKAEKEAKEAAKKAKKKANETVIEDPQEEKAEGKCKSSKTGIKF